MMRHMLLVTMMLLASCSPPRDVPLGTIDAVPAHAPHDAVVVGTWSFLGYDGVRLRSASWDIRTTVTDPALTSRLGPTLESGLAAMRGWISPDGPLPDSREMMITWLLGDRRQWVNLTRVLQPHHAQDIEMLGRGGFTVHGVSLLYDIDRRRHYRDTIALALHEGWHQYLQTAFARGLPHWLDEGLATQMEGYVYGSAEGSLAPRGNRMRQRRAEWMFRTSRMRSLEAFMTDTPHKALDRGQQSLLDFYAQAWAVTGFLLEHPGTSTALRQYIADAARGTGSSQLSDVIDVAALESPFQEWCRTNLRSRWRR